MGLTWACVNLPNTHTQQERERESDYCCVKVCSVMYLISIGVGFRTEGHTVMWTIKWTGVKNHTCTHTSYSLYALLYRLIHSFHKVTYSVSPTWKATAVSPLGDPLILSSPSSLPPPPPPPPPLSLILPTLCTLALERALGSSNMASSYLSVSTHVRS